MTLGLNDVNLLLVNIMRSVDINTFDLVDLIEMVEQDFIRSGVDLTGEYPDKYNLARVDYYSNLEILHKKFSSMPDKQ